MSSNLALGCRKFLKILAKEPARGLRIARAFLRGASYAVAYRIIKPNVRIKFPFMAFHKVKIVGPGSVSIGENCRVFSNAFQGLTVVTLSRGARVSIGKDCSLGGLTIRCRKEIGIGDKCLTANSLIQDTLFCEQPGAGSSRYCSNPFEPKPISIGNNVWIGSLSCILSGSVIDDNSVISTGSLCYDSRIKEYHLASGNPITRALPIEKIQSLLK